MLPAVAQPLGVAWMSRSRSEFFASSYSASSMYPCVCMRLRTTLRRLSVCSGKRSGLLADGFWTMPASIADCWMLSSEAGMPQYFWAAASTP